jgi:tetratricopeptide (TPR) repeat protein
MNSKTAQPVFPNAPSFLVAGAALALATAFAYASTLSQPFVFESATVLANNPTLRHLSEALQPPHDGSPVEGRPILNLSLALNYAADGLRPAGYHLANLAIHILAALALFGIVRRTIAADGEDDGDRATLLGFAAAILWAVHPLQTESVSNVIQRAESLMGLFYLLTLYCFIRGTGVWLVLSVVSCLLGMGTKEVMVSAPAIVLLYDRVFVAGSFGEALARRRAYYGALAATWLFLAWLELGAASRHGTAGFSANISWAGYVLTQAYAVVLYLRLAFLPHPQIFDYGTALVTRIGVLAPSILLVCGLLVATVWGLRSSEPRNRRGGFLGAWFFAILAPTCLVPVATQTIAEHRMYLPLAAVTIVLAFVLWEVCGGRPKAFVICTAIGVMALGAATIHRDRIYDSESALWSDTAAKLPWSERAHNNLGRALFLEANYPAAAAEFGKALQLQPNDNPEAEYNLGNCLLQEGRFDEAAARLREAVRIAPENPDGHMSLGSALAQSGHLAEAVAEFQESIRIAPSRPETHYNLALTLDMLHRTDAALEQYRETLRIDPNYGPARAALERLQTRN